MEQCWKKVEKEGICVMPVFPVDDFCFCFLETPPQLHLFITSEGKVIFFSNLERILKVIVGKVDNCGLAAVWVSRVT
jgi:hypothetical protein